LGWVTDDQLIRARKMPAIEYVRKYEKSEYKLVGKGYRLRKDDAFAVDDNGWYCHKKCIGGWSALDYLVEIKGHGLVDAVCLILGEKAQERSGKTQSNKSKSAATSKKPATNNRVPPTVEISAGTDNESQKQQPISLPLRHKDNKRVIAYLQSRDIDRSLIMACIERGVLYQSKYYHNAVFLGKDEYGKTRFAALRSTTTTFKQDTTGSDKTYGFVIPPDNISTHAVAVFESPIEALSHQTLCLQGYMPSFDGWRLSLSGISMSGLKHFLKQNPNITHCIVGTNNDDVGNKAMEQVQKLEESKGLTVTRAMPSQGDDWNKALEIIKKAERTQNRTYQNERG